MSHTISSHDDNNTFNTNNNTNPPTITTFSKRYRQINLDLLLASTSLTRSTKETNDAYLARVTHLHLQNKRIHRIEGLEQCLNLKVLYLYDNQIENIENLGFANQLQYLYLQNNIIHDLPKLSTMTNLRKLFLDQNDLTVITGLTECITLEELTVSYQRLPAFTSLHFDPSSMQTLSRSLQAIDISGNGISELAPFLSLYCLKKFIAKENAIVDLNEVEALVGLPKLEEANFIGNPCAKFTKYRDVVIGASSDVFAMLDEVPIPRHQQVAIKGLMKHRRAIGAMARFHPNHISLTEGGGSSISFHPHEMGSQEEV